MEPKKKSMIKFVSTVFCSTIKFVSNGTGPGGLATAAEAVCPESTLSQQQSLKLCSSTVGTTERVKEARSSTVSVSPRVTKEHYKSLVESTEYTPGSALDTLFQSLRGAWAVAADSGSVMSGRDATDDRVSSKLPDSRLSSSCAKDTAAGSREERK